MIIRLDSFSKQILNLLVYFVLYQSFRRLPCKICKITALSSISFYQIYRVTVEALIAETAVWPNFFLMNVFFAIKGSKLFIIISYVTNENPSIVFMFVNNYGRNNYQFTTEKYFKTEEVETLIRYNEIS